MLFHSQCKYKQAAQQQQQTRAAIIFSRCGDVIGTLYFHIHTGAGANKNKADDHKQNWTRTIFTATAWQQSSKVGVKKLKRSACDSRVNSYFVFAFIYSRISFGRTVGVACHLSSRRRTKKKNAKQRERVLNGFDFSALYACIHRGHKMVVVVYISSLPIQSNQFPDGL